MRCLHRESSKQTRRACQTLTSKWHPRSVGSASTIVHPCKHGGSREQRGGTVEEEFERGGAGGRLEIQRIAPITLVAHREVSGAVLPEKVVRVGRVDHQCPMIYRAGRGGEAVHVPNSVRKQQSGSYNNTVSSSSSGSFSSFSESRGVPVPPPRQGACEPRPPRVITVIKPTS